MNLFEYYAALRHEVLAVVTGVEDSHGLFWDNTTPNSITKVRLEQLFAKYLAAAKEFGLIVVTQALRLPKSKTC